MFESKDVSTCDDRQVKNKLNRLTKKKEGETKRMISQGMKIWKLGAFLLSV